MAGKNKQEKMGHAKAANAAKGGKVVEVGHTHRCPQCWNWFQHEDLKCQDIGLAYHICTVCKAAENASKIEAGTLVIKYDDILPEVGGNGVESQG